MEALLTLLGIFVGAFITLLIQKYDRIDKFRLVVIEKRMQAHQEAFVKWFELLEVIHKNDEDEDKINTIQSANNFWKNNALYLEKNTREGFRQGINIVSFYKKDLFYAREEKDPDEKRLAKERYMNNWDSFIRLIDTIQSEVELEPIKPSVKVTPEGEIKLH